MTFLRDLIAEGVVGTVQQVRAAYRQDWLVDPEMPLAWRLQKEHAGSGALGDIGAHIIDMTQFVTGQTVDAVSGMIDTIVKERPLLGLGLRAVRARPARASARSPSTTSRSSPAASRTARWSRSRPRASPPAARTP